MLREKKKTAQEGKHLVTSSHKVGVIIVFRLFSASYTLFLSSPYLSANLLLRTLSEISLNIFKENCSQSEVLDIPTVLVLK